MQGGEAAAIEEYRNYFRDAYQLHGCKLEELNGDLREEGEKGPLQVFSYHVHFAFIVAQFQQWRDIDAAKDFDDDGAACAVRSGLDVLRENVAFFDASLSWCLENPAAVENLASGPDAIKAVKLISGLMPTDVDAVLRRSHERPPEADTHVAPRGIIIERLSTAEHALYDVVTRSDIRLTQEEVTAEIQRQLRDDAPRDSKIKSTLAWFSKVGLISLTPRGQGDQHGHGYGRAEWS